MKGLITFICSTVLHLEKINLHGHSILQDLEPVLIPSHSETYPSVVFIWFKHCLSLVWIPLPHDLEHFDHGDQSSQVASKIIMIITIELQVEIVSIYQIRVACTSRQKLTYVLTNVMHIKTFCFFKIMMKRLVRRFRSIICVLYVILIKLICYLLTITNANGIHGNN